MADSKRQAEVEAAIERGLSGGGFQVHYQPIYSPKDKRFVSAEALVRLSDAALGPCFPDEFIPVAERCGSIHGIGAFVLEASAAFYVQHKLAQRGIEFIEVNLSVAECTRDGISTRIRDSVLKAGLGMDHVCLEVTETAAAQSSGALARNLKALSAEGFSLALDDYGSGYSNINYLAELPFNYVKLDRGMIVSASKTVRGKFMLEGSIEMCRRMGLKTIAEGVETKEQAVELERLGCDFLQGYYFSRPVSGTDFLKLLDGGGE